MPALVPMLGDHLHSAWRGLRRAPLMSLLMVVILAAGIAASMTSLAMLRALGGDPLPGRSELLLSPRLDTRPLEGAEDLSTPDLQIGYADARALVAGDFGVRGAALYGVSPAVSADADGAAPWIESGIATDAAFFAMMAVPFREGGPWGADEDARGADVAVIDAALARRVFGDGPAVGQRLRLDGRPYVVSGVLGDWAPTPKFYRVYGSSPTGLPEGVWVPFANAIARGWRNEGWTNCDGTDQGATFEDFLASECTWIQVWLEVATPADRAALADRLGAYVAAQQSLGRMPRPDNSRLLDVREVLDGIGVVGDDTRLAGWVAAGFLAACLVNLVALISSTFVARQGEIGLRRALGARRIDIVAQALVESGLVGLAGAALGLLLTLYGLDLLGDGFAEAPGFYRMDAWLVGATIALSVASALLAALVPTLRAAGVRPAMHLKSQ